MGDRCHVELYCYKKDVKKFDDIGFGDQGDEDLPAGICRMVDEEANGAHYVELSQLKRVFFGQHGEGYEYAGHRFVSDGHRLLDAAVGIGTDIVVPVDAKGDPVKGEVLRVKRYLEMLAKVSSAMGLVYERGLWKAAKRSVGIE